MTTHPQVSCRGIEVDENMAPLLELLWDRGFDTLHSCEGGRDTSAYISFSSLEDGVRFLQLMKERVGFNDFYVHAARYRLEITPQGSCVRIPRADAEVYPQPDMLGVTLEALKNHSAPNLG